MVIISIHITLLYFRFFIQCESGGVSLESHVYNLLYEVPAPPHGRCVAFSCFGKMQVCQCPTSQELPLFVVSEIVVLIAMTIIYVSVGISFLEFKGIYVTILNF